MAQEQGGDPAWLVFLAGALGGLATALYAAAPVLTQEPPASPAQRLRAALQVGAGVLGGGAAAFFLGPTVAGLLPGADAREVAAAGFLVGLAFWPAVPVVAAVGAAAARVAPTVLRRLAGLPPQE